MARLHVAGASDAPRESPATITEALESDARTVLAAMRLALAKKLDAGEVSSNAIASAYKELRELDRQIRSIDAADEQEAARRAASTTERRPFNAAAL